MNARVPHPTDTDSAVSPAMGPLPSIYVPQSPGEASSFALLWHVMLHAARATASWATWSRRSTARTENRATAVEPPIRKRSCGL